MPSASSLAWNSLHHWHAVRPFKLRPCTIHLANPATAPSKTPRRTHGAVVQQARAALRRFREDRSAGRAPKRSPDEPWRLLLDVPLPVASDINSRGLPLDQAPFSLPDEGDWPGGNVQKFRALRQVRVCVCVRVCV